LTRPKSSLSLHSPTQDPRARTQSFSSLPRQESQTSLLSPENRSGLRKHHSFNSSRSASPSGSWTSQDEDPLLETVHERERNWNSPRPKWHDHPPAKHASLSPTSPSGHSPYPHPPAKGRLHTESQNIPMSSANGIHQRHNTPSPQQTGRSKRLSLHSPPPILSGRESPSGSHQKTKIPHRTTTSSLLPVSKDDSHSDGSAASLGYGLVRNRIFLPPLDRDQGSPRRSHLRPHTPITFSAPVKKGSFKESRIPERSPRKTNALQSALQDRDFILDANHLSKHQSLPSIEVPDIHSENGNFGQNEDGSCKF
jgi:serine/arginine repetitive matrix protein 2